MALFIGLYSNPYGFFASGFLSRLPIFNIGVAPHIYNYVIWSLFFALILIPRYRLWAWPMFIVIYVPQEIIFNSLYIAYAPGSISYYGNGWQYWFIEIISLFAFFLYITKKKKVFKFNNSLFGFTSIDLFLCFIAYWISKGEPLITNWQPEYHITVLTNWPWEVVWQFLFLFMMSVCILPRNHKSKTFFEVLQRIRTFLASL